MRQQTRLDYRTYCVVQLEKLTCEQRSANQQESELLQRNRATLHVTTYKDSQN